MAELTTLLLHPQKLDSFDEFANAIKSCVGAAKLNNGSLSEKLLPAGGAPGAVRRAAKSVQRR